MTGKEFGKIQSVDLRNADGRLGFWFSLGGAGWGVGDFWGTWADDPSKNAKWTKEDQSEIWAEAVRKIRGVMKDANVESLRDLAGKPVEVTFDGSVIQSWRILKEVI